MDSTTTVITISVGTVKFGAGGTVVTVRAMKSKKRDLYVEIQSFLISALGGDKWSASLPGHITPESKPGTHRLESPQNRSGDLGQKKISFAPAGIRNPNRPTRGLVATRSKLSWPVALLTCDNLPYL